MMFSIYTISGVCQFSLETTPTKIGRNPASPRFTKGTCYLPILKSLGMAFPMVTRCLWWIPILNGKTRHQTPPFPPPKKKLRKKLPLKNADWGSLSLLLNAFSQVTFVHFQGGNFWSYTWIKYDKILLHQSEPEAHFLRCTHLMRNEPVSLLYLLGHGTHTSWDVPMFMEFLQDLQHQAEHQSQNLMTSSLFNVQGDLFPFFVIDMNNSQHSILVNSTCIKQTKYNDRNFGRKLLPPHKRAPGPSCFSFHFRGLKRYIIVAQQRVA